MSTKTTFKRIALVAVAALGFGTLSVVPSSAIALQKITLGTLAGVQTTTGTTNVEVKTLVNMNGYGTYNGDNVTYQAIYSALPATSKVGAPAFTALNYLNDTYGQAASWYAPGPDSVPNYSYIAQGGQSANSTFEVKVSTATPGRYNVYATLAFTPDKAGTYSILIQDPANSYTQTTWTVVVTDPVVQKSTAFVNTDSATASTVDATAANLTFAATASTTTKARLTVRQYSTTDTATAATTAISQAVVVAIDKGLVSKTNDYSAGAASVTTAAAGSTDGVSNYYVFANGTVGSASLTVTVGGVLLATKAIVFQGAATTLSAALTSGQKTWIAPTGTTTLTMTAKDSAGNTATSMPTLKVTSATTTVATATVDGSTVTITGVAAGTSVITIADSATGSTVVSATYTITVKAATTTAAATISFDKADYAPGELMTITIGADVADNSAYVAFTALPVVSVNVVTVTNPFSGGNTGTVAIKAGKATWTAYAPASGNVTITATTSAGPTTAVEVKASATVSNEALDAASEAIDAANAATDAANAAAEAADAATAAAQDAADQVAALSTSVSAMITALKKQITALTNLVIKIQKKVKA
jgi:hypothetical protein